MHVDASGCKREEVQVQETPKQVVVEAPIEEQDSPSQFDKRQAAGTHTHPEGGHLEDTGRAEMGNAMRETLSDLNSMPAGQSHSTPLEQVQGVAQAIASCDPQGLTPSICSSSSRLF